MNFYEKLPTDIIEYVSKNLYKDFYNKIKKKVQIKKDQQLARRLQNFTFQNLSWYNQINNNYIINNYSEIHLINYNNYYHNNNIDYDSDSTHDSMPELISIESDIEDIYN
tara:strand:+ start:1273 stop:1602 length:330 start_codon:yes stop_codon:yes gene_type:complete